MNGGFAEELSGPRRHRGAPTQASVLKTVRELTGAAPADLDAETPLMEVGVDSLAATELSSRLRALTGVALSPTLVFEQPTSRAVAAHLLEQVVGSEARVVKAMASSFPSDPGRRRLA